MWPQGSVAKIATLKNAIMSFSRVISEIMTGFTLTPNDVISSINKKLANPDASIREIADNKEMRNAVMDSIVNYVNEDYTNLRRTKLEGPVEISAGNIDSARIIPGDRDSPIVIK